MHLSSVYQNSSLLTRVVLNDFKHAVVQTIIKKNQILISLFSPIFPLFQNCPSFLKSCEKLLFQQPQTCLGNNGIAEMFKSGFKMRYSTENAHEKVFNDFLMIVNSGDSAILVLLDIALHLILWITVSSFLDSITALALKVPHFNGLSHTWVIGAFQWSELGEFSSPSAPLSCKVQY